MTIYETKATALDLISDAYFQEWDKEEFNYEGFVNYIGGIIEMTHELSGKEKTYSKKVNEVFKDLDNIKINIGE